MCRLEALALLFLLPVAAAGQNRASSPPVAITNVNVIDTQHGALRREVTVTIRDGRIASIDRGARARKGIRVVNGRGKFLIPGLWDMHVHLSWTTESALPVLVANGVTGVRDMGGRLSQIDEWRAKISLGLLVGPRIIRAGPALNGQKFSPYQLVTGNPDETRGVVRGLKEAGVDFLKVHRRLPRDAYFALIDEAKRQGLTVTGHIPMTVTPEEASDAGQGIEHTETLFEGTFSNGLKDGQLPDAIERFRAEEAQKLFARFVKNKTVVTPTLAAYRYTVDALDTSLPSDPRTRYLAVSVKKEWEKQSKAISSDALDGLKRTFPQLREVVRQMNRSGVSLMAGTDLAGPRIPGFSLHDELAVLVEVGLTPLQALQTATLIPARYMDKANDLGTVESGKLADLVVLDANPLEDIKNTQRIWAVVLAGKVLRRGDLDTLLRQGEQLATRN